MDAFHDGARRKFIEGYLRCLLWAERDESRPDGGDPLDYNYTPTDIAPDDLARAIAECDAFMARVRAEIGDDGPDDYDADDAGADFWLTRNGHGTGYWDRPELGPLGEKLSTLATAAGARDVYIGDDGRIYIGGGAV